MALFDRIGAANALEDLFDRERRAIMGGRFDVLDQLALEKERHFSAVKRHPGNPDRLARLKQMAERNRALLQSMDRGVRAAGKCLERMTERPKDLQTYDAAGQRRSISGVRHALQHRA